MKKCSEGKLSKIRITGMAESNAIGDKLLFCHWKDEKPMVLQERKVPTLSLQELTKKLAWIGLWLDEVGQRAELKVCY